MKIHADLLPVFKAELCVCSGICYGAMETPGEHKRDIMVARVRAARMILDDRED
jgi:hypothetical protein